MVFGLERGNVQSDIYEMEEIPMGDKAGGLVSRVEVTNLKLGVGRVVIWTAAG